jgi:site-specific recombinase XerD
MLSKDALKRNPTNWIEIKAQQQLAPRVLEPNQRLVLRNLVEKADDPRAAALFALGYFAGCRVSDVTHLLMEHTHIGPKICWVHVGHKREKFRDIDLLNEVRTLSTITFDMGDVRRRVLTSLLLNETYTSPKMAFIIGFAP